MERSESKPQNSEILATPSEPTNGSSSPSEPPTSCKVEFAPPPSFTPPASPWLSDVSFTWDKNLFCQDDGSPYKQSRPNTPDILRTPSPKQLLPAVGAGALEETDLSKFWGVPSFSLTAAPYPDFMANPPLPQYINPTWVLGNPQQSYVGVYSPVPQYPTSEASFPSYQASWSLSDYTQDVPAFAVPQSSSNEDFSVTWDQIYNPPSAVDLFSAPSSYDLGLSSPSSSVCSNESFSLSPFTPQEFDQFLLSCAA